MQNTKVYDILSAFTKIELNRCRKYVFSPYFNHNTTINELFDLIAENIYRPQEKEWTKEEVWEELLPDEPFNDVRLRKYFSDLLKLVEGFLAQEIYEERPIQKAEHLMEAVGIRKISRLYNSTIRTAKKLLEKQDYYSSDYFLQNYLIEKRQYVVSQYDTQRSSRSNIDRIANNLDQFYFFEKLRFYCLALSRQSLSTHEYQFSFVDEVIQYLEQSEDEIRPNLKIYLQILLLYQEPENESNYFAFKENLANIQDLSSPEELIEIYVFGINFCIQKINTGQSKFLNELFDLHHGYVEMEVKFKNELSPWVFRNAIVVALRLGKYQWTEHFIQQYSEKIPEEYRSNAVTFNLATLHFYQKHYDKVIELLRDVEYEDVSYNLNTKTILIQTYYETGEIEPLYSLFESFRAYLNRNKEIADAKKTDYKNLIRFTKKLTRIYDGDQKSILKLRKDIKEVKRIASRKWLLEKLAELE